MVAMWVSPTPEVSATLAPKAGIWTRASPWLTWTSQPRTPRRRTTAASGRRTWRMPVPGSSWASIRPRVDASRTFMVTTSARPRSCFQAHTGTWSTAGVTETTRRTDSGRAAPQPARTRAAPSLTRSDPAMWMRSPGRSTSLSRAGREGSASTPGVTIDVVDPSASTRVTETPMSPTSSEVRIEMSASASI